MAASLEPIVSINLTYFQSTRASCCQAVLSKAVGVFGGEPSFVPHFQKMLETVRTTAPPARLSWCCSRWRKWSTPQSVQLWMTRSWPNISGSYTSESMPGCRLNPWPG